MSLLWRLKRIFITHDNEQETKEETVNKDTIQKDHSDRETETQKIITAGERIGGSGTLLDLAMENTTYWKFSQTSKEKKASVESYYKKYIPGTIATPIFENGRLSFVRAEDIGKCAVYGDQLTKFDFDLKSDLFNSIKTCEYSETGNSFRELTTKKLVVEHNYSIKNPKTVALVLSLSSNISIQVYLNGLYEKEENRLERLGCKKSADFVRFLKRKFDISKDSDLVYIHDHAYELLNQFLEISREQKENKIMTNKEQNQFDIDIPSPNVTWYEKHNRDVEPYKNNDLER